LYRECLAGAQIIFSETGRGLGHVTNTFFGIRSNISPKLLELQTSNLVDGFVLGMPSRRTNNFPESGRGLGHVTPTIFGSTVGYPSDNLASCLLKIITNASSIIRSTLIHCVSILNDSHSVFLSHRIFGNLHFTTVSSKQDTGAFLRATAYML